MAIMILRMMACLSLCILLVITISTSLLSFYDSLLGIFLITMSCLLMIAILQILLLLDFIIMALISISCSHYLKMKYLAFSTLFQAEGFINSSFLITCLFNYNFNNLPI